MNFSILIEHPFNEHDGLRLPPPLYFAFSQNPTMAMTTFEADCRKTRNRHLRDGILFILMWIGILTPTTVGQDSMFSLQLTHQTAISEGAPQFHRLTRQVDWPAHKTAVIVCDVWDAHHSINAVRRLDEFVTRLDEVLKKARDSGAVIIHAPSDCMPQYTEHPARRRSIVAREGIATVPAGVQLWCSQIPNEETATYPIDQSDGGEDDDPEEHQAWARKLADEGRNPGMPWLRQHPKITIDPQSDYISDRGDEVWAILEENKIEHVILTGVHTNMCVLGRPFGLRQLARVGKDVVLMRDMTDTMYNPQRWPFVSHFSGTDRIIDHVERHVCPTLTSDQLLGGQPFQFKDDHRPHVVFVIGESLYDTATTLPKFAEANLGKHCRVSFVYADSQDKNHFPGLEVVQQADLVVLSVRRRTPPAEQLALLRDYVASGKPIMGLRTSSHAFSIRDGSPQPPLADWPELDQEIWGGSYHGHHPDTVKSEIVVAPGQDNHPWLQGCGPFPWDQSGSLYQPSPLAESATLLLAGEAQGQPSEPVAWTFQREDGGLSFYTSLGHPGDFEQASFNRFLNRAIHGMLELPLPETSRTYKEHLEARPWQETTLAANETRSTTQQAPTSSSQSTWYRCAFRLPSNWLQRENVRLVIPGTTQASVWVNGETLQPLANDTDDRSIFELSAAALQAEETSLLVVQIPKSHRISQAPWFSSEGDRRSLAGRWETRHGDSPNLSGLPLPAKFGTSSDIYIEPMSR